MSDNNSQIKQGPVERSILEYVLQVHSSQVKNRTGAIALLLHSELIAHGARLLNTDGNEKAILTETPFNQDPIRLTYNLISRPKFGALSTPCCQLQLSVVETEDDIFVNLTDTATNKFGHLEISSVEHVRLDTLNQSNVYEAESIFPQMFALLNAIEENLFKPVLPSPPFEKKEPQKILNNPPQPQRIYSDTPTGNVSGFFPEYGRSDLDPLGGAREPFPDALGRGRFGGGMIMDPRSLLEPRNLRDGRFIGGPDVLPPGAVPPGARFDPFGPGFSVRPNPRAGRRFNPDPDHALPPGFEDMYM